MTFFVVAVDGDVSRRTQFLQAARACIPTFAPLATEDAQVGDLAALWARPRAAPTDACEDGARFALLLGDAFRGRTAGRLHARSLLEPDAGPRDGLHVAIVRRAGGEVVIEADLLGILPVYYVEAGGVFLAASTPDVLRRHPLVGIRLDPAGLVGVLLTNGLVGGRTLLEGIRRLGAGRALRRPPGGGVTEVVTSPFPRVERHRTRSLEETTHALEDALRDAVRRHVPPETRCALLLSGGLDSRLLAGCLADQGSMVRAWSLGLPHEDDVRHARRVAKRLGFPHASGDAPPDLHPELSALLVRHEGLASGIATVTKWFLPRLPLGDLPRAVSGAVMDTIVGPEFGIWGTRPGDAEPSFEGAMAFLTTWGIAPGILRRLLRPEVFDGAVEAVQADLRRAWEGIPGDAEARAWHFLLRHRHRFHTGSTAFALAFGAWPALPAVDRRVLETVLAEPRETIGARRAHRALLCTRFPALASLPVDRNAWSDLPLLPSRARRVEAEVVARSRLARRVHRAWRGRRGDPRRYHRVFDVNGPGWRRTRARAENARDAAHAFFDPDVLRELLPGPDEPIAASDRVAGTTGAKNLAGFLLWIEEYLA